MIAGIISVLCSLLVIGFSLGLVAGVLGFFVNLIREASK